MSDTGLLLMWHILLITWQVSISQKQIYKGVLWGMLGIIERHPAPKQKYCFMCCAAECVRVLVLNHQLWTTDWCQIDVIWLLIKLSRRIAINLGQILVFQRFVLDLRSGGHSDAHRIYIVLLLFFLIFMMWAMQWKTTKCSRNPTSARSSCFSARVYWYFLQQLPCTTIVNSVQKAHNQCCSCTAT